MIRVVDSQSFFLKHKYVWIYKWNAAALQFYCIPKDSNKLLEPVAVNLSLNFAEKYNHILIITRELELFKERTRMFLPHIKLKVLDDRPGHLIMRSLSPDDIMAGKQRGVAVLLYCGSKTKNIYKFLKNNYYPFYIEAMGTYQNSVQCFIDHQRRLNPSFGSRGLFEVTNNNPLADIEDRLSFVTENMDKMPPYNITAFDIEAARLDANVLPRGDTIHDRLCSVAFHTMTVYPGSPQSATAETDRRMFVYCPKYVLLPATATRCATERELVGRVLSYLAQPSCVFLTGWNIVNYDFPFLLKRAAYYKCLPPYLDLYRTFNGTLACDLAPPWKLSIDTMECRKQFFPRHLPVNPPSNSLNNTAKVLLCLEKMTFNVTDINRVYRDAEMGKIDQEKLSDMLEYNMLDAELVSRLNSVLQVVPTLVPLSQLADLDPGDCLNYNTTRVGVTFMRNQFQSVQMAPIDYDLAYRSGNAGLLKPSEAKYTARDVGRKGTYKGALVLEPEKGVHKRSDGVLGCLDFASLYPSIMISYGIMRGYVSRVSADRYRPIYDQYFTPLKMIEDPENVYLSTRTAELAPIHNLCKSLIEKRTEAKRTKASTLANALKILVNSLYGICGVKGVLYDVVSAAMITGYGRLHLTAVKNHFERLGLRVLYGDTDSVFIAGARSEPSLTTLALEYNRLLSQQLGHHFIQLSVDGEYDCIIFIRKKLYMAQMVDKTYKMSGFPQRMEPGTHTLMTDTLTRILNIVTQERGEGLRVKMEALYSELFRNCVEKDGDDRDIYSYPVKIRPANQYKSKTSKHYYLAEMVKNEDVCYVSVCEVIPLVKKITRKSLTLCLAAHFNPELHTLNKSAAITEFFSKTFDPILKVVCHQPENERPITTTPTLAGMSAAYKQSLQNASLIKYKLQGFQLYDFSECKVSSTKVKICVRRSWPAFYSYFIQTTRNKSQKIAWVKEDDDDEARRVIVARISFHDDAYTLAYLVSSPAGVRTFKNLFELERTLKRLDQGDLLLSKLFLTLYNPILTPDVAAIMKLLCFIYGKSLTRFEIESLGGQCDKYLILLPFVAVRIIKEEIDFIYF